MTTLYEKTIFILKGKTKLCNGMNLDFYELTKKDLSKLELYENETIKYKNNWFIIKTKEKSFNSKQDMDNYPNNWIKYPYKEIQKI